MIDLSTSTFTVPFLGHRTYIQSSTLLDTLLPLAPESSDISIVINTPIITNEIHVSAERPAVFAARFRISINNETTVLYIREGEPSLTPYRVSYDEDDITSKTAFESENSMLVQDSGYTIPQTLIAANKKMLNHVFSAQLDNGKWIFVKLDLKNVSNICFPIRLVTHSTNVGRLVETKFSFGNSEIVGNMYHRLAKSRE